jgi:hypothetical protein
MKWGKPDRHYLKVLAQRRSFHPQDRKILRIYAFLLKECLRDEMPTRKEMWAVSQVQKQKAIMKNIAFQKRYLPLVEKYQELQKELIPDDPHAGIIEKIRKGK